MGIHTRLRAMILITLVPVAIFGVAGAWVLVHKERETLSRGIRDQVRAIQAGIDTELLSSVAPLRVLAQSPALDRDDLAAFRIEAQRALDARGGEWANVLVSRPDSGEMLMNLLARPGEPPFAPADAASIVEAAKTGKPTISGVVVGPILKRPLFGVRVPVMRDGRARYVLTAVVEASSITELIEQQGLPLPYSAAVLDRNFRFVVRRPNPGFGNEFASESLRTALTKNEEGWERGTLLDGTPVYRAFRRSSATGWSTSIAVPEHVIGQGLLGTWLLVFGFLAAAVVGFSIAWVLAARITRPIAALARAAPAVAQGDASAIVPDSPITEVRDLARALQGAAVAIHERDQRQRSAEKSLRDADRAKDEFLAMLGHELRNPLSSVANATQLLAYAEQKPDVVRSVREVLSRQVEHMTHLLDDLLEVGRLAGGKIRLDLAPFDLGSAADELITMWRNGGRFAEHVVHVHVEPTWIAADRVRIDQVLGNLIDNAIKYTPAGRRIEVGVGARDGRAILEVRDEGEGVDPELLERVFDLFVQGERTLAREKGGLGIGLTLARRIVELHAGEIGVRSDGVGRGSTFTVTLPLIERPDAMPTQTPEMEKKKMDILIVEDNADARDSLVALLELLGHHVTAAESGVTALSSIRRSLPRLALVDIGLPDMDGLALARAIREVPGGDTIRLIALTGYGSPEDQERTAKSGFDAHLIKPLDLDVLEKLLQTMEG